MGYYCALVGTVQWTRGEAYPLVGGLGGRYDLHGLYPGYAHRLVWFADTGRLGLSGRVHASAH